MPSEKIKAALRDILDNIAAAQMFVRDIKSEDFGGDLKTLYATTRALEIICEACVRLPDELKGRYPDVAWRDIKDAGNFYRHSYDNVAASFIWKTIRDYLPSLAEIVQAELESETRDIEIKGRQS